ncbi:hypothetical protein ACFX2H_010693 [Malus domestica]
MAEKVQVVENKQVIFKGFVEGTPKETDLQVLVGATTELKPPKGSGAFLVKNLYLSCDPYMRGRMRDFGDSYIPPFVPGQPIEGFGVSKVVGSDNPTFKPGDFISGFTRWEEYSLISRTEQLRKVTPDGDIPLSFHVGLLGNVILLSHPSIHMPTLDLIFRFIWVFLVMSFFYLIFRFICLHLFVNQHICISPLEKNNIIRILNTCKSSEY